MGFWDFMFEDEESEKKRKKPRKKLSDLLFEDVDEQSNKPKKGFWDFLFEEEKPEVEFTDPEDVQNMSETLSGKLQDKKRVLTMMGLALRQIDIKEFPGSGEIIQSYLELVEMQQKLSSAEEKLQEDDIMDRISLERDYEEFEQKYNSRIPRIKTLFYFSELKKQNKRMDTAFNKKTGKELTEDFLADFQENIQKITEQQDGFSDDYKEEIMNELLTAEYRLRMLKLMREIYLEEEPNQNPFSKYSKDKKGKFVDLLLADITKADEQYQQIMERENLYTKTKVLEHEDFEELSQNADDLNTEINNGILDDLSMAGMFENEEYDSLKMFIKLKLKMNQIDSKLEQAKNIDLEQYKRIKKSKGKDNKHNPHGEERKIKLCRNLDKI